MNVKPVKDDNEPKYPDLKMVVKSRITPGRRAKMALAFAMTAVTAMSLSQCNEPEPEPEPNLGGLTIVYSQCDQTIEESTDASETATAGVALLTEETTEATASEDATETALAVDSFLAD